ncbi:acyltransferase [Mucilaginibacter sp. UYCu711]|uniref:acyltransferase n=1 Tax=Mucilaginibacter sp. UYCu711 TaxID=3156339 RepID=UPI003D1A3CB7
MTIKDTLRKRKTTIPVKYLLRVYIFLLKFYNGTIHFFKAFKNYLYNDWLTNFPSNTIRILYLKKIMRVKVGESTFIHMGCRFEGNIDIGNNTVLGRNCIFKGEIIIKNNVSITAETYIFTSSHIVNDPDFNCFYKAVVIEDYAWIGARAMIMPGVTIGKGAVLAALSVATKDIPDFNIFAGTPAKSIGLRNSEIKYKLNYFPFFQ